MVAKFIGLFLLCYQLYHPGMTIMFFSVDVTELSSSSSSLLFIYFFFIISIFFFIKIHPPKALCCGKMSP